jgi:alanyl-tRNA synthetase
MNSKEIRSKFLTFFESKRHTIVPSAPMVVHNDPTLMFTNAGMNQFKDFFLGNGEPKSTRIADTQKCLRVSGKHNDLEEVGLDTYHHTMFEMLGNWSFGDYFKKEAIEWAWELLTEVYKLPKDRLYVSIFGGDPSENLERDIEAFKLWSAIVAEDKIIDGSKKDNFWEMGDVGPCGPCSEIHIDLRSAEEVAKTPGRDLVNNDHPQVVEIWNLVFMQFNRKADGSLVLLPAQHVDTGMGFERLAMAVQGKKSNYDTDVFQPLIQTLAKNSGKPYGETETIDIAIRVISDHIRAISFAIADGQLPSNVKAGYVIRRILRRAVRYGYTFLGFTEPFMYRLVDVLAEQFSEVFPELNSQKDFVARVIMEEESSFLKTLERGLKRIEGQMDHFKQQNNTIDGKTAFELYDTFGFPLDLTALIARENGLKVDESGFDAEMTLQKSRSKMAAKSDTGDWVIVKDSTDIAFVGYDFLKSSTEILKYREVESKGKKHYQVVLSQTPFYAESGGQVGDAGFLVANGNKYRVEDTKKENDLIIHILPKLPSEPEEVFEAIVDETKRVLTMCNHSATHLLHAALKSVLGEHVNQKGSLVDENILRFDFSHFAKMTDEEITKVETIVNQKIRANIKLQEMRNVPIAEAKNMGATALFGEKYGDFVRVIVFDKQFSIELCGGTHVPQTGMIGFMKIVSESSTAAGVRRIEAITSVAAENYVKDQDNLLNEVKALLKNPKDLVKSISSLLEERTSLNKELEQLINEKGSVIKTSLLSQIKEVNGAHILIADVSVPNADVLKKISFELKNEVGGLVLVLAATVGDKPLLSIMIDEAITTSHQLHAGNMVRELAKLIKGGGGGQPFYATAGGSDLSGLAEVVKSAKQLLAEKGFII